MHFYHIKLFLGWDGVNQKIRRKITLAAARIAQGKQDKLLLGNLSSLRDWGYAKDYVECMWLILQQPEPEDFVIATGVQHSVREFTYAAFKAAGIELKFEGEEMDEKGICVSGPAELVGKTLVEVSPDFYRPTDVVNLWGDPTKAKTKLLSPIMIHSAASKEVSFSKILVKHTSKKALFGFGNPISSEIKISSIITSKPDRESLESCVLVTPFVTIYWR